MGAGTNRRRRFGAGRFGATVTFTVTFVRGFRYPDLLAMSLGRSLYCIMYLSLMDKETINSNEYL